MKPKSIWHSTQFIEKLSYIAFEGSTLTFLGLLNYDTEQKKFTMSKISAIIAGGAQECVKYLTDELVDIKVSRITNILCATLTTLLALSFAKKLHMKWKKNRLHKKE